MLNVMIVDDEPIIRLGIKASIEWERLSLRFAGEYANGAEALNALREAPADILITDIKMPLMDGLELTRQARALHPSTKVILISSYNDFDYVRQGIVLGAKDYILKATMEPEELNRVIGGCVEAIREETETALKLDLYRKGEDLLSRRQLEQDMRRLLAQEQEELEREFAARFAAGYLLVRAAIDRLDDLLQQFGQLHVGLLMDDLKEVFYRRCPDGIGFVSGEGELLLLLDRRHGGAGRVAALKGDLEREGAVTLSVGYFEREEPGHWSASCERTRQVYARRFFEGAAGIHAGDGTETEAGAEDGRQALAALPPDEAGQRVSDWLRKWERMKYDMMRVKQEASDLFSRLFVRRLEPALMLAYYQQIMKAETLPELGELLENGMRDGEQLPQAERASVSQNVVHKAMAYIREHYTQELTLQMVADHVHISRNYFSVLFKKQTELNFIDYIIQLRIAKAKELLRNRSAKVYEVAELTGFNDVKYFSKLFKKMTGSTPADYRDGGTAVLGRESHD
ncbi:response regulator [Cohnella sp. JJ-181]|uniref:response regulator n=1 Tax=Cohnella rhizoplanae TaxID=2974897 RepID=UPI0022FF595B|nr:response regulator [Cohnella sp. JJ-181]CAI6041403.1 HTH-type transcriptional activator RhaR [Cohnella sp. JJ-181]